MLHEDSKLCSFTPDFAAAVDGEHADLIERFAVTVRGWRGIPIRTRLEFEKQIVGLFIQSMQGGLLEAAIEAGRQDVYNLAAVGMFQVMDVLTDHDNPAMLKACLGIAIGTESRSQTEVAEQFGVVRATISKWARRFVRVLNLVPSRGMRRPQAVEAYRQRALKDWEGRKAA